jgi:hypothetical protein
VRAFSSEEREYERYMASVQKANQQQEQLGFHIGIFQVTIAKFLLSGIDEYSHWWINNYHLVLWRTISDSRDHDWVFMIVTE